jgi:hypothetical protein
MPSVAGHPVPAAEVSSIAVRRSRHAIRTRAEAGTSAEAPAPRRADGEGAEHAGAQAPEAARRRGIAMGLALAQVGPNFLRPRASALWMRIQRTCGNPRPYAIYPRIAAAFRKVTVA